MLIAEWATRCLEMISGYPFLLWKVCLLHIGPMKPFLTSLVGMDICSDGGLPLGL